MSKATAFFEIARQNPPKRPVDARIKDFQEIEYLCDRENLARQAARCMDCGIPFCHAYGCPLNNRIPEFNEMIYRGRWRKALDLLHATNNFPEITGRICPELCEGACTLGINRDPVSIRQIELQIIEHAFAQNWVSAQPCENLTGKKAAIIGSGPAGLAAAQQLARNGHRVTVFEKSDRPGGLLRYGIPDFKLDKGIIERRLKQLRAEGVEFETGVDVGVDISAAYLRRSYDAILLAMGAGKARTLDIPGNDLQGVSLALPFLIRQNLIVAGDVKAEDSSLSAAAKHVVVIGGGDTGADCVGAAVRQGALSVTQIEILPKPPMERAQDNPWPTWPRILRTGSSHEEGCERIWSVLTHEILGKNGVVNALRCSKVAWTNNQPPSFEVIPGSDFELKADLVLLALGFTHVEHCRLLRDLDLKLDERGNIQTDFNCMTSQSGIFAAGDASAGASLVVRAINDGRNAAEAMDRFLGE